MVLRLESLLVLMEFFFEENLSSTFTALLWAYIPSVFACPLVRARAGEATR